MREFWRVWASNVLRRSSNSTGSVAFASGTLAPAWNPRPDRPLLVVSWGLSTATLYTLVLGLSGGAWS